MPNNPGRIAGDYSAEEKEEIRFVDPGSFGAQRKKGISRPLKIYLIFAAIVIIIIAALAALQAGLI